MGVVEISSSCLVDFVDHAACSCVALGGLDAAIHQVLAIFSCPRDLGFDQGSAR